MTTQSAIVIITSSFPISGDGSEAAGAFVADLAEELAKHVPVRVVAPGRTDTREPWTEGVEVFRYATPDQALSTLKLWQPVDGIRVLRVLRAGQRATEQAVTAGPTAHVLALWALPCGYWARRSARRHGIGYSAWTLGSDIWSLGHIPVVRSLLRRVLRDAVHCWSDGLKLRDDTQAIAGRPVKFLPSTRRIDRARTEPLRSNPPYRMLFLGRWHPNKGIDLLLDALALLSDEDWSLIERVTIAGGGPLEPLVKDRGARLQAVGRPMELRGYLTRDEAQEAMLATDYLLIPSRIESIPVVFSDAVKTSTPVLCTAVGDLAHLVNEHRCGLVASSTTSEAIAETISKAIRAAPSMFSAGLRLSAVGYDLTAISTSLVTELNLSAAPTG